MARDYYSESVLLAATLRDAGPHAEAHAERIEKVIAAGFTSTEILMGLRVALGDIARGSGALSEELRASAEELASGIDDALA